MHNPGLTSIQLNHNIMRTILFAAISIMAISCSDDDGLDPGGSDFGKVTSAVVIVNPVINAGSATTVTSGTQREGVSISAADLAAVSTNSTGLAVLRHLPTGMVPIEFSSESVNLNVVQA